MELTTDRPTPRRRAGALATIGAVGAILAVSAGTGAYFTDQEVITGNELTAGTLDLTTEASATFDIPAFAPGESEDITVTVGNGGSLDLRYALTGGFEAIQTPVVDDGDVNFGDVLDLNITGPDGEELFTGQANEASTALLGDPTQGQDAGDRDLTAGAEEELTFTVTFPTGVDQEYAGSGAELTLTFDAEQVDNND